MTINRINQMLGVLVIFTAPIDRYLLEIPFIINLSVYRILLFTLITSFIIQKAFHPKLYGKKDFYYLVCAYILGMTIGVFQSRRLGEFSSYFMNELMGILLMVIFSNIYDIKDIPKLIKVFIGSFVFPLIISAYVYYVFYYQQRLVNVLPLSDVLPMLKTIEFDTRPFRTGIFPRLGLPYSTPPHLAIVSSIILIFVGLFYQKNIKYALLVIIGVILVGTLSRTVIVSMFLTAIVYFLYHLNNHRVKLFVIKKKNVFIVFAVSLIIAFIANLEVFKIFENRVFQKTDLTEDRHFILIIEAILIVFGSVKNLFIGIGDGNLIYQTPVYTFLPPDSVLNSYLTLLVHRGLIGFVLNILIYFYLLFGLINTRYVNNRVTYALLFSLINVLFAFCFYELRFANGVWLLMACIAIYINKINVGKS